ncbi:hypothetical protein [Sporosarcina sp. OR05]|uniref:hypothetical protein n=1 Tax=Sporosarcina sp. OR05 TaxID=2969819 RepID=UPI00352ABEAB
MINHGVRKGYTSIIKDSKTLASNNEDDIIPAEKRTVSSVNTLNPDLVEGFAFHMGLIAIATLIGWFMQKAVTIYVPGIPLFPLVMIGGLLVNMVISRTKHMDMINLDTFKRIQGFALDFLIIGAVASIKVPIVIEYFVPLLILTALALGMMIWYFYYLGKRFFPENWFENAIVHYGSYTGVAAVGLLLLRTVDPEMETDSGKAYALRAPFYSPFLGGGLITSIIPVLMLQSSSLIVGLV